MPFLQAVEDMSHDQDTTDLMKCLSAVRSRRGAQETVIVTGAFGGRLDHSLANLWALHMSPEQDIVLVGDGNAARCADGAPRRERRHESVTRVAAGRGQTPRSSFPQTRPHREVTRLRQQGRPRPGMRACPAAWTCNCHDRRPPLGRPRHSPVL